MVRRPRRSTRVPTTSGPASFAELVSSLDGRTDAVDLLHRCARIEGGGDPVHLLGGAS